MYLEGYNIGSKGFWYFLDKESCMIPDIYISKMLKWLELSFYKQCIKKKGSLIWMNDAVGYHMSKTFPGYHCQFGLICKE